MDPVTSRPVRGSQAPYANCSYSQSLLLGGCGNNGEGCTLVEATLKNGGSAADISLISPYAFSLARVFLGLMTFSSHEFSVTSGFGFYGGCDGAGTDCK